VWLIGAMVCLLAAP